MSFLVRCRFVLDNGDVIHDETTVAEIDSLDLLSKGIHLPGLGRGVLEISFDPPLVAEIAVVEGGS